jgi:hypothetical protein
VEQPPDADAVKRGLVHCHFQDVLVRHQVLGTTVSGKKMEAYEKPRKTLEDSVREAVALGKHLVSTFTRGKVGSRNMVQTRECSSKCRKMCICF